MKEARFSNGYTDEYKGARDVKAAWAIISKDNGETLASGHSLDRKRAQGTANNTLREIGSLSDKPFFYIPRRPPASTLATYAKTLGRELLRAGYDRDEITIRKQDGRRVYSISKIFQLAREHNQRRQAEMQSKVKVEIVDL